MQAYHYMQELRTRMPTVSMTYFVNVSTIESVHRAVGVTSKRSAMANGDSRKMGAESDDEVTEEIFDGAF